MLARAYRSVTSRLRARVVAPIAFVGAIAVAAGALAPLDTQEQAAPDPVVRELRDQTQRAEDLRWLREATGPLAWPDDVRTRPELVQQKARLLEAGDQFGAARARGILAAEAQIRAARVLERWQARIDPETGLLPKGRSGDDNLWDYADAGADLYPHLRIATALLAPGAAEPLTRVIAAERTLGGGGLPSNVDLTTNRPDARPRDRMYGAIEYAKDGLLPLMERLGPGPWLVRLEELARAADAGSAVATRHGPIPSDESEVNGQALQVFARLAWITGDARYAHAADRIARAYLESTLPNTGWVPPRSWDFDRERQTTSTAQLRDHGNEVVAGLVEYHLVETVHGSPRAADHRQGIRQMLDRLLEVGRRPNGLWESTIDLETGRPLKDTLSDGWGYLYAAYLTQAMIEERWPGGDLQRAERYRAEALKGLHAAAQLDLYPWQGNEQDGYADTIESALYLLNRLDDPEAAAWVDRQAGTLFGAQQQDGRVEDRYLDGNFVRTALLYAGWQSQGTRLDPWTPTATVGAVRAGDCLALVAAAGADWDGRLVFDGPRHVEHMRLPVNYPRLNEWPEWFAVESGARYRIEDVRTGETWTVDGASLRDGLPLTLGRGAERHLRVCGE